MTLVNHVDLQLHVWGYIDISPDNALWEGVYHIYTTPCYVVKVY